MRSPRDILLRSVAPTLVVAAIALSSAIASAEPMTLTDILGRTIRAEPIAVEGDSLRIRRDDGREFTIELKSLVEEDQERIRAWNATRSQAGAAGAGEESKPAKPEKPKYVPDMAKLQLSLSRFKGDTNIITKWEGYTHKHEMWGYSFQVSNRNIHPIENVRIEYNLFARTFSDSSTPSVVTGSLDLPPIGSNRSEGVKTKTAEVCKQKGEYTSNTGGELRGIWVKLYVGDKMVQEQISPGTLKTEVEWVDPREAAPRRTRTVEVIH